MSNPVITLTGRIGTDPEMISYSGGVGMRFRMATSERRKNDATGQWEDKDTSWWTIKAWKSLAEQSKDVLKKGMEVTIVGKIKEETYVDKQGNQKSSYDVNADSIAVTSFSLSRNLVGAGAKKPEDDIWNVDGDAPF